MKVLAINASPRRDGNSSLLVEAAVLGAQKAGHNVTLLQLDDFVEEALRDCRSCRRADGSCSIPDDYERLLIEHMLPAQGLLLATPLYWYGMSGRLKTAFDRLFCYMSEGYANSNTILDGLPGKRVGVLIACEESYQGATLGLRAQFQELTRYPRRGNCQRSCNSPDVRGRLRLGLGLGGRGQHFAWMSVTTESFGGEWGQG